MEQVLLVIEVLVAIALIAIILLQRSDSDGFGLSSGSGSNLLSGRGTANLLTRTTAILAGVFMLNALILSVLAAHNRPASIVDVIEEQESKAGAPSVPAAGAEKAPAVAPASKAAPEVPAAKPEVTPAAAGEEGAAPKKPIVKPAKKPAPQPDADTENTESTDAE